MVEPTSLTINPTLSRLKLFWALSRTPHGLLDMATPALSALLWLGAVPSLETVFWGLITVFAGYSAVYALNDIVDLQTDKEKLKLESGNDSESYLDALIVRHPLAQGLLSLSEGMLWSLVWALIALWGAYHLNPVCALIFLIGCVLEIIYCRMLKVSYWRTVVSGIVKTLGPVAAVFAVDSHPALPPLIVLFCWLFFWEIGGQNIPADWHDFVQDQNLQAKTIPVQLGLRKANIITLSSLSLAVVSSAIFLKMAPTNLSWLAVAFGVGLGIYLLLVPAVQLFRTELRQQATFLFNRASYYPVAMLVLVLFSLID